jgi:hypothetical protein
LASNVDDLKLKVQGLATTADIAQNKMARSVNETPRFTWFGQYSQSGANG